MVLKTLLLATIFLNTASLHKIDSTKLAPRVFERQVSAFVDCVRGILNDGLPDFGLPSLNPLIINNFTFDLSSMNVDGISGIIQFDDGLVTGIPSFVLTKNHNTVGIIPPSYTINLAFHYDQITANANYLFDVTIFKQKFWGKGSIFSEVENLDAASHIKLIVSSSEIKEFDLQITLEKYNLTITGLMDDEELSKQVSESVSALVPDYIKSYSRIFSKLINPTILTDFVDNYAVDGLIKEILKKCKTF